MESTRKSVLLEKVGYRTKPRGSPTFRICVEGESAKETEKYRRERSNTKKGHPRNQGGGGMVGIYGKELSAVSDTAVQSYSEMGTIEFGSLEITDDLGKSHFGTWSHQIFTDTL